MICLSLVAMNSLFSRLSLALPAISLWFAGPVKAGLAPSPYTVGPLTTSDAKWATKVCDVTKYGAVADGVTDLGPPLLAAFEACSSGGVVNIPSGTFAMATWATLSGGSAWAINLEGTIIRTGTAGGHMIVGKFECRLNKPLCQRNADQINSGGHHGL